MQFATTIIAPFRAQPQLAAAARLLLLLPTGCLA